MSDSSDDEYDIPNKVDDGPISRVDEGAGGPPKTFEELVSFLILTVDVALLLLF